MPAWRTSSFAGSLWRPSTPASVTILPPFMALKQLRDGAVGDDDWCLRAGLRLRLQQCGTGKRASEGRSFGGLPALKPEVMPGCAFWARVGLSSGMAGASRAGSGSTVARFGCDAVSTSCAGWRFSVTVRCRSSHGWVA